jgi:hypothetical protein
MSYARFFVFEVMHQSIIIGLMSLSDIVSISVLTLILENIWQCDVTL